jgi:hypothetical protein
MNNLHDPELELFKRTVDLADYAKRAGYELRPQDGAPGLTVLDHPNRDRIVVGQHPNGLWVYASVPDYALRAPGEPAAEALARLRRAIDRSKDKGTVVEFVQQRDPMAGRAVVPLDQVRAIACEAFEPRACPSTSKVPSLHRLTHAVASCRSNRAAMQCPRADRADPNPSSTAVATTGVRPSRTDRARQKSSAGSGSGARRKRRSTGGSVPRAKSRRPPHCLRFQRTVASRGLSACPPIAAPRSPIQANRSSGVDVTTGPPRRRASTRSFVDLVGQQEAESDEDGRAASHIGRR